MNADRGRSSIGCLFIALVVCAPVWIVVAWTIIGWTS